MSPAQTTPRQTTAEERARLWMLVWRDIAALRQLVNESQQRMDDARAELRSRAIGTAAARPSRSEQNARA
jgi:hypothetical protein